MMIKHLLTLPSPTELGSDPSVAPPTPEYKEAATDRDTARSRHGYIINYAGCNPSDGTSEGNEEER